MEGSVGSRSQREVWSASWFLLDSYVTVMVCHSHSRGPTQLLGAGRHLSLFLFSLTSEVSSPFLDVLLL